MFRQASLQRAALIVAMALACLAPVRPVFAGTNVWTSSGPAGWYIYSLAIDPLTPATVYAGTFGGGGIFKSTNGGGSWSPFNTGLANAFIQALVMDPATPTSVYAATSGSGVISIQQIASVSPSIGLSTSGTTVTIQGLKFTPASGVTVTAGGVAATKTTLVNSSTLTATTSAHAPGAVDVVVTNPNLQSVTLPNGFVYADVVFQTYLPVTSR